eukprot:351937-Chlamydomonas_euryale.AAC.10
MVVRSTLLLALLSRCGRPPGVHGGPLPSVRFSAFGVAMSAVRCVLLIHVPAKGSTLNPKHSTLDRKYVLHGWMDGMGWDGDASREEGAGSGVGRAGCVLRTPCMCLTSLRGFVPAPPRAEADYRARAAVLGLDVHALLLQPCALLGRVLAASAAHAHHRVHVHVRPGVGPAAGVHPAGVSQGGRGGRAEGEFTSGLESDLQQASILQV